IDTKQRMTLHRVGMQPELAREVCKHLESAGRAVLALQDSEPAEIDYLVSGDVELNEPTLQWMAVTSATVHRVGRLAEHGHEHTVRVGIVAPPEQVAAAKLSLERTFAGRIVVHSLYVA